MTDPAQFTQDLGDLISTLVIFGLIVVAIAWPLERRLHRRRRELEILPPPEDGREHNAELIADWQRRKAGLDRLS